MEDNIVDKICILVAEFNYLFGVINYQYEPSDSGILIEKFDIKNPSFNQKQVELRLSLIKEECDELTTAVQQKNKIEIVDALCDILYVVAGAKVYFNLPNTLINEKVIKDNLIQQVENSIINQFEIIELVLNDQKYFNELYEKNNIISKLVISLEEITNKILNFVSEQNIDYTIISYNECLDQIIYQVLSLSNFMGLDIYKMFSMVHDSNMSKACSDFETAIESIDYYKTIETRYSLPNYKEINYNGKNYWIIYDEETKKILKSFKYSPVNFFN